MNFLNFIKWIPVGLASTILLNAMLAEATKSKVSIELWLVLAISVAIASMFWILEKDHLILEEKYGISFPLQALYFLGLTIVTVVLTFLIHQI